MPAPKFNPNPPNSLNPQKVVELIDSIQVMLPTEVGLSDVAAKKTLKTENYSWKSPQELSKFVRDLTEQENIKDADYVLNQWQETYSKAPEYSEGTTTMSGAPEYGVTSNTLTPDQLKQFQEDLEAKEVKRKVATQHAETNVDAGIKKQQEIYAKQLEQIKAKAKEFEEQAKFAKIKEAKLAEDQQKEIDDLTQDAKADPIKTVEKLSEEIEERSGGAVPKEAADVAAFEVVSSLSLNYVPVVQTSVAEAVSKEAASKGEKEVAEWITYLSGENQGIDLSKEIITKTFGQEFTNATLPEVEVANNPGVGLGPVSLAFIPQEAAEIVNERSKILDEPFLHEADYANKWFGSQLALMQGDRSITQRELYFSAFKPQGKVDWQGINGQNRLNVVSGASEPLKLVGGVAGGVAKQAASKVATKAVVGFLAKLGAPETGGLTLAAQAVANWVIDHVNPQTMKRWALVALAAPIAIFGALFGVPILTALGLLGTGVGTARAMGITAAQVGSGTVRVLGALAGATLGAIGLPVLITLLAFPVAVALVLFIINSGAYVVPPQPLTGALGRGVKVECSTEKGPVGVDGPNSSSPIAKRAWEITYDLYQGFWCFWNRSPVAPAQYFPNDTLKYPPGYPDKFDYALFLRNPNPPESGVSNLFWCTWLIVKAYQESGSKIATELYVPNMYNDFKARGKILDAKSATPSNVVPGSVVFFQVTSGEFSDRLNHVGVVYSVDPGGMVVVESNNAIKSESINFSPGRGAGNLPGMLTRYFGLP